MKVQLPRKLNGGAPLWVNGSLLAESERLNRPHRTSFSAIALAVGVTLILLPLVFAILSIIDER